MSTQNLAYEIVMHVNSMVDREARDLMIDTAEWDSYLINPIKINHNQHMKVSIESIEIPNTAYTFPLYESTLWWIKDVGGADTLKSLDLPIDRNFATSTDLVTYINAQMVANSDLLTFSYDSSTNKLTVTNGEAVPIRLVGSYRFDDTVGGLVSNNIIDRLGFVSNLIGTTILAAGTLVATGILRLLRTNVYYLATDILGGKIKQSNVPNPLDNQFDICARVSSGNYGTISQLRFGSTISYNVLNTIIHKMHFVLLDDQLEHIALNGSPITFSMKFSVYN